MDAIKTAKFPSEHSEMKYFSVARNVCKRILEDLAKMSIPVNDYLREDEKLDWLIRTTGALGALTMMKSVLVEPTMLALSQPHRP